MIQLKNDFIESLVSLPGVDSDALLKALDTPPAIGVRRNRHKDSAFTPPDIFTPGVSEAVGWCADGVRLRERPSFTLDPLLHAGAYYVQDPSSMIYQQIVERLAGLLSQSGVEPLCILDFCAAPGGKTTAIINALPPESMVVANEFNPQRGKILRENLEKWGYPRVITTGSPSSAYAAMGEAFDIVAVDAPCSGEGMMRKEEIARSQWSAALVEDCARLQREILRDVASTVRPGGYLIYSTCTFNLKENEENSIFISDELGLEPVGIDALALEGFMPGDTPSRALLPGVEALRFMPHLTDGEGLYVSVFHKPGDITATRSPGHHTADIPPRKRKSAKGGKKGEKSANKAAGEISGESAARLRSLVDERLQPVFEMNGDSVTMLPGPMLPLMERLKRCGVFITGAGLPIAGIKGNQVIPDSRLPLSTAIAPGMFPTAELSKEDALRYLRRESLSLPPNIPAGYVVVTYEGRPLGMVKNLGSRANNLYPRHWRIRNL